jgi:hypothetical protein
MEGIEIEGQVIKGREDRGIIEDLFSGDLDPDIDKIIKR